MLRVAAFGSLTVEDAEAMLRGLDVIICKDRYEHPYSPPDVIANDASPIRSPKRLLSTTHNFPSVYLTPNGILFEYMRIHITTHLR